MNTTMIRILTVSIILNYAISGNTFCQDTQAFTIDISENEYGADAVLFIRDNYRDNMGSLRQIEPKIHYLNHQQNIIYLPANIERSKRSLYCLFQYEKPVILGNSIDDVISKSTTNTFNNITVNVYFDNCYNLNEFKKDSILNLFSVFFNTLSKIQYSNNRYNFILNNLDASQTPNRSHNQLYVYIEETQGLTSHYENQIIIGQSDLFDPTVLFHEVHHYFIQDDYDFDAISASDILSQYSYAERILQVMTNKSGYTLNWLLNFESIISSNKVRAGFWGQNKIIFPLDDFFVPITNTYEYQSYMEQLNLPYLYDKIFLYAGDFNCNEGVFAFSDLEKEIFFQSIGRTDLLTAISNIIEISNLCTSTNKSCRFECVNFSQNSTKHISPLSYKNIKSYKSSLSNIKHYNTNNVNHKSLYNKTISETKKALHEKLNFMKSQYEMEYALLLRYSNKTFPISKTNYIKLRINTYLKEHLNYYLTVVATYEKFIKNKKGFKNINTINYIKYKYKNQYQALKKAISQSI